MCNVTWIRVVLSASKWGEGGLGPLASFPGPSPPRRGLLHTACACAKYSVIFSVKEFVHFLVRMRKIVLTKYTELSLN